jgi:hypothetical protein
VRLFRRCASRTPDESELAALAAALDGFRARYRGAEDEAKAIAGVGTAMRRRRSIPRSSPRGP